MGVVAESENGKVPAPVPSSFSQFLTHQQKVNVFENLAAYYPKIKEGVQKTVGGNLIMFDALRVKLEGIREGINEARNEGIYEERKRITLNMIRDGMTGNIIMSATGGTKDDIDTIAKENGFSVCWENEAVN